MPRKRSWLRPKGDRGDLQCDTVQGGPIQEDIIALRIKQALFPLRVSIAAELPIRR